MLQTRKELEATRAELLQVNAKAVKLESALAEIERLK
jgi:hypothetical protein